MSGDKDRPPRGTSGMSLAELARRAGVSARTIRYYISQGLVPRPCQRGRNARYGPEHLERLQQIRRLKQEGRTLAEIRRRLDALATGEPPVAQPPSAPELWYTYRCGDDVIVQVRATASPWRLHRVRSLLRDLSLLDGGAPPERGGCDHDDEA